MIGLANAGLDTTNAMKGAAEFGIAKGGQKLATLLFTLSEVHGLGLAAAQGAVLTEAYYWDLNDTTRAFGNRFLKRTGRMPNMIHAGTYSCVLQYLKAMKAAGTDETEAVTKHLHAMPVNDAFCAERQGAGQWQHEPRDVSVRGEIARGEQGAVGLLQAARQDPRQRGVRDRRGERMPADGDVTPAAD